MTADGRLQGQISEPPLLSLSGRIDDNQLDAAVSIIEQGAYPEWRILRESRQDRGWSWAQALGAAMTLASSLLVNPPVAPIRTIVVEHIPTQRRETLAFEFLGRTKGLRYWRRA